MTSTQHIILFRKLIRDWFKGKIYDAENETCINRKCTYEITNVRVEYGTHVPKVILDVKLHSYQLYANDNTWVNVGKPGGSRLRGVNNYIRRLILEDKCMDLLMFDISKGKYYITVGVIKWELNKK